MNFIEIDNFMEWVQYEAHAISLYMKESLVGSDLDSEGVPTTQTKSIILCAKFSYKNLNNDFCTTSVEIGEVCNIEISNGVYTYTNGETPATLNSQVDSTISNSLQSIKANDMETREMDLAIGAIKSYNFDYPVEQVVCI